jgi:hypothetical protein
MSGTMERRLQLTVPIIVLVALAASSPGFAKEAHSQHGAHATANKGASTNGASANSVSTKSVSTKAASPAETKSNSRIDVEATVPPPVLPPQGFARQRNLQVLPSVKIVTPGNSPAHTRTVATTTHAVRNAIGQPVVQPKNFTGTQTHVSSALQTSGAPPQPVLHGGTASAPVVSSFPARSNAPAVNVANLPSRSINGAAVIRPAVPPSGIGGPARATHGINGTAVQNKH